LTRCSAALDDASGWRLSPEWKNDLDRIQEAIQAVLREPLQNVASTCLAHGDLWAGNIIVDEQKQRVTLIDFEWSCIATPLLDLARLYGRGFIAPQASAYCLEPASALWQIFARAYGDQNRSDPTQREFQALLLYTTIRTLVFYLNVRRGSRTPEQLAVADGPIKRIVAGLRTHISTSRMF
jgi:aminoglycoside phosphotransferase (APT) family kinase protein